jgi:hypothetical protein
MVKNTTLRLVRKTILVVLDLLKSTCFRKPKWFFDPSFWFEKPKIIVVTLEGDPKLVLDEEEVGYDPFEFLVNDRFKNLIFSRLLLGENTL